MGLLIGSADTIRIPLHVEIADGDDVIEVDFVGVYQRTTKSVRKSRMTRLDDLRRKHEKALKTPTDGLSDDEFKKLTDEQYEFADAIDSLQFEGFIGCDDLKGHGGESIPFSEEAKAEMLQSDPYRIAIMKGMAQSNGVVDRKN